MNKLLEKIVKIANENLEKYLPKVKKEMLEENGTIYYMNDIDGTVFDWGMNERLCEFMMFYDDSGMGAIKLNVLKNGKVNIYLYKNNTNSSFKDVAIELFSKEEVLEFVVLMYNIADKKDLYGKSINNIENIVVTQELYNEFEALFEE